jgi:hypothetical protein
MAGHRLRTLEKKLLRKMRRPTREEVTKGWRKLHKDGPNDFYPSPNTIREVKLRRMR